MKKNDIITLDIIDISSEGSGIGKYEGMAIFVPLTAVGDTVKVRILKVKKNYAFARVEEIVALSSGRIAVDCDVFSRCGGCVYRHIDYSHECELKQNRVKQTMMRIGGVKFDPMPIIAAQNPNRYRNKALYPVAENGEIGFYSHHSHRIVTCSDCALHPERFKSAGEVFTAFVQKYKISTYNEESSKGLIRHFYLREGKQTGEIMVGIVINGNSLPHHQELVEDLKVALGDDLKSVILNVNTKNTNVVLGEKYIHVYGDEFIEV